MANSLYRLLCRFAMKIMSDGGSCQEHRGIMFCDWPLSMAQGGRRTWPCWPFTMAICSQDHFAFENYPRCSSLKYNYFVLKSAVMYDENDLWASIDRMFSGRSKRLYVRLAFECTYSEIIQKTQERIIDRMRDMGISGMIQTVFKAEQNIIDISVSE